MKYLSLLAAGLFFTSSCVFFAYLLKTDSSVLYRALFIGLGILNLCNANLNLKDFRGEK
jgi:hypothetical protein